MTDTPEDIKQIATRFAGEYLAADISCDRLYRDVVRLLVAERERCAQIAGTYKRDASFDDSMVGAMEHNSNQANIAAAIRSNPEAPHT